MFKNFVKIAWRHLTKNALVTILQVGGLTIGLTVVLLISLWVNNQLSYDRFHKHADRIFKLELHNPKVIGGMPLALSPYLKNNFAEIDKVVRLRFLPEHKSIMYDPTGNTNYDKEISERVYHGDSTFFSVFSFQFIYGDAQKALIDESSIVLKESLAKKMFSGKNPIGRTVMIGEDYCTITGVIKNVNNFHIPFEAIRPFHTLKHIYAKDNFAWDVWGLFNHPTYVLIAPNVNVKQLVQKMNASWKEISSQYYAGKDICMSEFKLIPVKDIYLTKKASVLIDGAVHGDKKLLYGLSLIGFLILLLATVNFINLNATQTIYRSREVGIHKIAGSSRKIIFLNICGEIVVMCLFALILAIGLVYIVLPYYNNLIYVKLLFAELFNRYNILIIGGCFMLIITLAGILPALSISSFSPILMLKNMGLKSSKKGKYLNKTFLCLQYVITIIVLTVTLLVQKQISFFKNSDPGFNMTNVLVMDFEYVKYRNKFIPFKNRLLQHPSILNVSYGNNIPAVGYAESWRQDQYVFEGKEVQTIGVNVHPEYFDLLEIPITDGRNFLPDFKDLMRKGPKRVLINETAVKAFELENPVGTVGRSGNRKIEIIGVVKDFHGNTLKSKIPPTVFNFWYRSYHIMIKYAPNTFSEVQDYIRTVSEEMLGSRSRQVVNHLDDLYYEQYRSEDKLGKVFWWFSLLSVIIATLGLYGISVKAIQQRIKEVGIRKAMGASSLNILIQLLSYFGKIILWSGVFALPIAWYLCYSWLTSYAYKTAMSWWIFAGSFFLAFIIAITTISYKTWRAADSNPAEAIKYE